MNGDGVGVTDGPFWRRKEIIAGYARIEVGSAKRPKR
jgi:hypothetical protein